MTRCEAHIGWRAGEWSAQPVTCRQAVGVRPIIDATATVRWACSIDGHEHNVLSRFGRYAGELAADELAAVEAHARCCGAGGSTPHWVHCPERTNLADWAPGEITEAFGR